MRGIAGAGPDVDPTPPRGRRVCDPEATVVVALAALEAVDEADVEDVVIEVVGVVAAAVEVCLELPHAPSTSPAPITAKKCAESLTFGA
jgi:hypothetical protein